ncbi:hypothetical protein DL93DRAFT_2090223 [Clavulina sp. PMI_390]|nr:hypothetical protein DL93DRAFT_2090223 [Clavulina sp. PMI_390]
MPDTTTAILGQYMLQGWILTDDICPTPKCNTPLMRAPKRLAPETFCATCDGGPIGSSTRVKKPETSANVASSPSLSSASASSLARSQASLTTPADNTAVASKTLSRASTPPTEVSEPDPMADDNFVLPPPTEEMLRRRRQSDYASAEIGKKLLAGWAMLGDECPNSSCFGVPLVRPPKRISGVDDAPKECVVCNKKYVVSDDGRLQELQATPGASSSSAAPPPPQPTAPASVPATSLPPATPSSPSRAKGNRPAATAPAPAPVPSVPPPTQAPAQPIPVPTSSTTTGSNPTIDALETAVTALTDDLNVANVRAGVRASGINAKRVGELSVALKQALEALEVARRIL